MAAPNGNPSAPPDTLSIVDAPLADLLAALSSGATTSVDLTLRHLLRLSAYDTRGPALNSIPLLNPSVLRDAARSDARRAADRAAGRPTRPLEGLPFTVKDSYAVRGLTLASGSPAFTRLTATDDAFAVRQLREVGGAVLLGRTNMPPMAAGGMQRGAYGRAESPYNGAYLTAAFASGSSNGSATSTAAGLAAFGMGGETVSSGRSPASNNGLVAYTPSRGVLSLRGSWPLYATCDVVVPHTRRVGDLLALLDVLVARDPVAEGDFWREQRFVAIPDVEDVRPPGGASYAELADAGALKGKRIAVPRMYVGKQDRGTGAPPAAIRPSVLKLFDRARKDLEKQGAALVETDFPLVANYEAQAHGGGPLAAVPGLPDGWIPTERGPLLARAWDAFLRQNGDPGLPDLSHADLGSIFPMEEGPQTMFFPPRNRVDYLGLKEHVGIDEATGKPKSVFDIPGLEQALKALEAARKRDLEDWMDANGFDLVAFPANGDVGKADADVNEESAREAWRNGVMYSNGNRVLRHLGVPTVSICMGVMEDTGMPVNITFAGKAYADSELLKAAYAYEQASKRRIPPGRTPALPSDFIDLRARKEGSWRVKGKKVGLKDMKAEKVPQGDGGKFLLKVSGRVEWGEDPFAPLRVYVDGEDVSGRVKVGHDGSWSCSVERQTPPKLQQPEYLRKAGVESVLLEKTIVIVVAGRPREETGDVLVVD